MKKSIFTLFAAVVTSAQVFAISVSDVCGQFNGNLFVGGDLYENKDVYILPGTTVDEAITFVLPNFTFGSGNLGNITIPNIPMDETGLLVLTEPISLYIDSIGVRATVHVLSELAAEGAIYHSIVSEDSVEIILTIEAPTLPNATIYVLYQGDIVADKNYEITNGGFEGDWTNYEPEGWHSFYSATGDFADLIKNNEQFIQTTLTRPSSAGSHSALLSSKMVLGVAANGNCTNGQINAGSTDASLATGNYNFSKPNNEGFNTLLAGRPDSLIFWVKYQPADLDYTKEVNKARVSSIITTNHYYQDPEDADVYADVKVGVAYINYSATSDLGWQRIAIPYSYNGALLDADSTYILTTFTTNQVPGGGTSKTVSTLTSKYDILDTVILDDVKLKYNNELAYMLVDDDMELSFTKHVASVETEYCDDCYTVAASGTGLCSKVFTAYDAVHKCAYAYVIGDDYSQSKAYNVYRVEFTDSDTRGLKPIEDAIIEIPAQAEAYEKVIVDGQILIRRGNKWYNVSGVQVR